MKDQKILIVCPKSIAWGDKLWRKMDNSLIVLNAHKAVRLVEGHSQQPFNLVIMSAKPQGMSAKQLMDTLRSEHGITCFRVVIESEDERDGQGVDPGYITTAEEVSQHVTSD